MGSKRNQSIMFLRLVYSLPLCKLPCNTATAPALPGTTVTDISVKVRGGCREERSPCFRSYMLAGGQGAPPQSPQHQL